MTFDEVISGGGTAIRPELLPQIAVSVIGCTREAPRGSIGAGCVEVCCRALARRGIDLTSCAAPEGYGCSAAFGRELDSDGITSFGDAIVVERCSWAQTHENLIRRSWFVVAA